jgi:predicted HTH domain antitoxin
VLWNYIVENAVFIEKVSEIVGMCIADFVELAAKVKIPPHHRRSKS